jgi:hypothetical protein
MMETFQTRKAVNRNEVVRLRGKGLSIEKIADQLSIGKWS